MKGKYLLAILLFVSGSLTTPCNSYITREVHFSDTNFTITVKPYIDSLGHFETLNPVYGLQFYNNGILYMQNTKNEEGVLSDYSSFGRYDIFYVPFKNFQLGIPDYFMKNKPFPIPPGTICFTPDQKTFYYSRPVGRSSGHQRFSIFKVEKDPDNIAWIEYSFPLSFCNETHSFMHPALSADGSYMIFVSDQPASEGGKNLFKSEYSKEGWSKPADMGTVINSNGDELFPFLDRFNNLYFSSNKNTTKGFDIYYSHYNGTNYEKPVPLDTINTPDDDMIFKMDPGSSLSFLITFKSMDSARVQFYIFKLERKQPAETIQKKKIPKESRTSQKKKVTPEPKPVKKEKVSPPPTPKPAPVVTPRPQTPKIVFRVQIFSSMKAKDMTITLNNRKYQTWHYYYKGAYRYTIGQFDNVNDAIKLKNICTRNGYPQAFVAAFKGKERITDPKVFRH